MSRFFQSLLWLSASKMKFGGMLNEYEVIGRVRPTEKKPDPKIYKMKIFAPNAVVAKSKFWYFISKLVKAKKSSGEILQVKRIREKKFHTVKNIGIWLRYDSRSGTHNMYREYRDLTPAGAVTKCYRDMGSRHRARAYNLQIIRVKVIKPSDARRPHITQFHNAKIRFPLLHNIGYLKLLPLMMRTRPNTMMKNIC